MLCLWRKTGGMGRTFVGRQNKQPEGTKCLLFLEEDEGLDEASI